MLLRVTHLREESRLKEALGGIVILGESVILEVGLGFFGVGILAGVDIEVACGPGVSTRVSLGDGILVRLIHQFTLGISTRIAAKGFLEGVNGVLEQFVFDVSLLVVL